MGPNVVRGDVTIRGGLLQNEQSRGAINNLNSVLRHASKEIAIALAQNPSLGKSSSSSLKALTGFFVKALEKNPECLDQIHSVKVSVSKRTNPASVFGGKSAYTKLQPVRLQVKVNAGGADGVVSKLRFDSTSKGSLLTGSKRSASPSLRVKQAEIEQAGRAQIGASSSFKFSGEFALQRGKMAPVNGHGKFADGTSASGFWRIDKTTKQSYLVEGTVVYPSGLEVSGKFLSPKELIKSGNFYAMSLAKSGVPILKEGSVKYPNKPPLIVQHSNQNVARLSANSAVVRCMTSPAPVGQVNEQCRVAGGHFALDPASNEIYLRNGIVTYPSGEMFSGDFCSPSELRNMRDPLAEELVSLKVPVPKHGTLDSQKEQGSLSRIRLDTGTEAKILNMLKSGLIAGPQGLVGSS